MSPNPIVHIEFASKDPKASGEFFTQLLGWEITVDERFDYVQFEPGDGPGGAFPAAGEGYQPGETVVYVGVSDIDATLAKAESLGAKITEPKSEIPDVGFFAWIVEPSGAKVALFQGVSG